MTNEDRAIKWLGVREGLSVASVVSKLSSEINSLTELLDAVRLDEAEWWWNHPLDDGEEESQRIAALREGRGK